MGYSTDQFSYGGPWLITKEQLIELDSIINETWDTYQLLLNTEVNGDKDLTEEQREKNIKDYLSKAVYGRFNTYNITITLKNQKVKKYNKLIDALKDLDLNQEEVICLKITLSSLNNNLFFEISRENSDQNLRANVNSDSIKIKEDICFKLDNWINKVKPKKYIELWCKFKGLHWVFIYGIIYIYITIWTSSHSYKSIIKEEAYKLLNSGINENNVEKAVELLLKLNSNWMPLDYNINYTSFFIYLLIIIFLGISISFAPKTTFDIGLGKRKINIWKTWINFATIFLPFTILIPIFINILF